jgi:hypothetical protein
MPHGVARLLLQACSSQTEVLRRWLGRDLLFLSEGYLGEMPLPRRRQGRVCAGWSPPSAQ